MELKFLTIKSIYQKQLPGSVLQNKCSQKFRKTDGKKTCVGHGHKCFYVGFAKFSKTIFLLNKFDLSHHHVVDVSHDFVGRVPSS